MLRRVRKIREASDVVRRKSMEITEAFKQYFNFLNDEERETREHTGEYSAIATEVFLFGKPRLFFQFVDHTMVLIAFYLSLWVVNFTYAADALHEPWASGWRVSSRMHVEGSSLMKLFP